MAQTLAIVRRQLIQITKDIWTLILLIATPLLVLLFSNFLYLNHAEPHSEQWLYQSCALLCITAFIFPCLTGAVSILRDKKLGTLEQSLASPVSRGKFVLGYLFGIGTIIAVQTIILLLFAIFIFQWPLSWTLILLYILLIIEALAAIEIGFFIAVIIKNALCIFLSIAFASVLQMIHWSGMPGWRQAVSIITPVYYSVEGGAYMILHRYLLLGFFINAAALIVFIFLFFILNIWALQKIRRV
ncbi:ABC-type multidrug transport system permease subunit [Scopulibacillus daqui]|uniref:ABC-type multidrug transport system permease subunit n=1 Tax=Scopulibacillus daqui TaxID=1469162 RepID=A0ABS2PYT4_9BACL|nr:ABC transporter permease [Scopulibacillus daqui]MBM7645192.1 ABC-type multidrug transport system permease subunit [Scopulibacillus daqui]